MRLSFLSPLPLQMAVIELQRLYDKIRFLPSGDGLRYELGYLSYLSEEQQYTLLEAMGYNDATPSLAQAIKMKKFMQEGKTAFNCSFLG